MMAYAWHKHEETQKCKEAGGSKPPEDPGERERERRQTTGTRLLPFL